MLTSTQTTRVKLDLARRGPRDGRCRRPRSPGRRGRLRHRRPPARRARPRGRPADRRARRRRRRRGLPDVGPRRLGDRRSRLHRGPRAGAWSPPATRWPRSSPTGCSAAQATFPGADTSTKLKLLGVDVASFGDAFGATEGALEIVYADPVAGVYKKLVLSDDARTLLGGILVGDASAYAGLRPMVGRRARRGPGRVPAARGRRRRSQARAARRRAGLLVQQRVRGHDPRRRTRRGLQRPRRCEGVHAGRHQLRLLPAAGEEAGQHRARQGRCRGQQGAVRALRAVPGRAVRRRPGDRSCARSARSSSGTAPAAAATSASRRSPRSWPAWTRPVTSSTASGRRCRTPTTT